MEENSLHDERPSKRLRVESPNGLVMGLDGQMDNEALGAKQPDAPLQQDDQLKKEIKAGIIAFVHPDKPGFSGVLKQRYSDFLVNEISPDGTVLHLKSLGRPKKQPEAKGRAEKQDTGHVEALTESNGPTAAVKSDKDEPQPAKQEANGQQPAAGDRAEDVDAEVELADDDRSSLETLFGARTVKELLALYKAILRNPQRKAKEFRPVDSDPMTDRETRTKAHQAIRRIFNSRIDSETRDNNAIHLKPSPPVQTNTGGAGRGGFNKGRGGPRLSWEDLGGEYCHFTLYKENKDTMESIFFLATQLRINVKRFNFGGTKDRRAISVQRACAHRVHADELIRAGARLRNAKIGDFEYSSQGLELGQLGGNEFGIALRDCKFPGDEGLPMDDKVKLAEAILAQIIPAFSRDGFINYYGLQRFGSFTTGTADVGLKLLQGDLAGAVNDILFFNAGTLAAAQDTTDTSKISSDDKARAQAIDLWQTKRDTRKALELLPRKFSAERGLISHLGGWHKGQSRANDFQGAFMTIPRALRLMYVHAYQSLVWNTVAGERWRLHGARVVAGDLVLVDATDTAKAPAADIDEAGEPIVRPAADDSAADAEDDFQRARPLSADEAGSGKFNIFDVVLPLPGFDVVYPPNAVGDVYKTFMASERGGGIDPYDMRRSWKDISLSGGYRKLLGRPMGEVEYEVKTYSREDEQLTATDLQCLEKEVKPQESSEQVVIERADSDEAAPAASKLAVVLKMQLAPSQYATMALRELMGAEGVKTYKPDFGGGRTD